MKIISQRPASMNLILVATNTTAPTAAAAAAATTSGISGRSCDDELSVSSEHSTFTVVNDIHPNQKNDLEIALQREQLDRDHCRRRRRRKSVHFDTSRNEYHDSAILLPSAAAADTTWLSHEELKRCKGETVALAREIYRADLQQQQQQTNATTYSGVVLDAYETCCRASREAEIENRRKQQRQQQPQRQCICLVI